MIEAVRLPPFHDLVASGALGPFSATNLLYTLLPLHVWEITPRTMGS